MDESITAELLQELQGVNHLQHELEMATDGGNNAIVTAATRKKKKGQSSEDVASAVRVREVARALSKKNQKRVEQIRKRKVTEMKLGDYLEVINSHQITDTQRALLTSSKQVGQSLSLKQLISNIYHKEQYGLPISVEERELLYHNRGDSAVSDNVAAADATSSAYNDDNRVVGTDLTSSHSMTDKSSTSKAVSGELLFSFDDIFETRSVTTTADPILTLTNNSKAGNNRKRKKTGRMPQGGESDEVVTDADNAHQSISATSELPAPQSSSSSAADGPLQQPAVVAGVKSSTVGAGLLSQLMKIKESAASRAQTASEAQSSLLEVEVDSDHLHLPTSGKYIVQETAAPVSDRGEIIIRGDSVETREQQAPVEAARFVRLQRSVDVQAARMQLPICAMEQEIVEAIRSDMHDALVLCGETGSGKSTQIPQFLYEAGFSDDGIIGITQPRRVAVTSTAARVLYEMTEGTSTCPTDADASRGQLVGYQIRFDSSTVGSDTKIKFMTDGILLREIAQDLLLRKYRVVILDEAHERNVNTDVLLGMLSRVLPLRRAEALREQALYDSIRVEDRARYEKPLRPLKLVVMSATLRVDDFLNPTLFPMALPPVVRVEARQFPVTTHFSKRTELRNYLKETFKKVCQIHRKLPEGGVLVFLTGKREILYMCSKLHRKLNSRSSSSHALRIDQMEAEGGSIDEVEGEATVSKQMLSSTLDELMEAQEEEEEGLRTRAHHESTSSSSNDNNEIFGQDGIDSDSDSDGESDSDEDDEQSLASVDRPVENQLQPLPALTTIITGSSARDMMLKEAIGGFAEVVGDTAVVDASAGEVGAMQSAEEGSKLEGHHAEDVAPPALRAWILPLYALMPSQLQNRVFQAPPEGHRLIVVATNVAETSITIPGIRYVVDCGRQKMKVISSPSSSPPGDPSDRHASSAPTGAGAGIAKYEVTWISQASADQRQGRAGRTAPGHCYRLFSSNYFHQHMQPFRPPEISATPLEELVLQMKSIGIEHIESFPFPTAPPQQAIRNAVKLLTYLGALSDKDSVSHGSGSKVKGDLKAEVAMATMMAMKSGSALHQHQLSQLQMLHRQVQLKRDQCFLTALGSALSRFPINPRYAKMLVMGYRSMQQGLSSNSNARPDSTSISRLDLLAHAVTLVATLAERSAFESPSQPAQEVEEVDNSDDDDDDDDACPTKKGSSPLFHHEDGDALARLRATGAYLFAMGRTNSDQSINALCKAHRLHVMTLRRISDLRRQLQDISLSALLSSEHRGASTEEACQPTLSMPATPPTAAHEVALRQLVLSGFCDSIARKVPLGTIKSGPRRRRLTAYYSCNPALHEVPLYMHPTSNLFERDPTAVLPEYIVYGSLVKNERGDCIYMNCLTRIAPSWIASVCADCPLLKWGEPHDSPGPYYDGSRDAVMCFMTPSYGTMQWELPAERRPLLECHYNKASSGETPSSTPVGFRKQDAVFRWFARLLLEGSVSAAITSYDLLSAPLVKELRQTFSKANLKEGSAAMVTQMKPIAMVSNLVRKLTDRRVWSMRLLVEAVGEDPTFLSEELQPFLAVDKRRQLRAVWQKMAAESSSRRCSS